MPKPFIALYGITNLGKTTQVNLIDERCKKEELKVWIQKYPKYDLEPTGPLIHEAIKGGNPKKLSAGEIQALMARNRFDFQNHIDNILYGIRKEGLASVVAEMYTGTGIAYGMGEGVNKDYLLALNQNLRVPDISILLDGERFLESVEKGHRFEEDSIVTAKIRAIHLDLASEMGWHIINANRSISVVHEEIWDLIKDRL
jgi:thymidylate kinase